MPRTDGNLPRRPLIQRLGAILWPSFFTAGAATLALFSISDPLLLQELLLPEATFSRIASLTLFFFLLWLVTCASSLFTWILLRPASRFHGRLNDPRRVRRKP